jgi:hypothetical protein
MGSSVLGREVSFVHGIGMVGVVLSAVFAGMDDVLVCRVAGMDLDGILGLDDRVLEVLVGDD